MTLRLLQIGLGAHGTWVAKHHAVKAGDFIYSGIVDVDADRLRVVKDELGLNQVSSFTNYKEAFSQGVADAVLVTAASPFHYEICKEALLQGLHVLVEKPFVTDLREAEELVQLAKSKNLTLMASQNYRWNQNVVTLKDLISKQVVGEPMFVDAKFFYFHEGKNYQREMQDYMLLEMAIHHVDMMRFLFEQNIKVVRGRTWNTPDSGYRGDPNVHAIYDLEGGMPIYYLGSLISHGYTSSWEGNWRIQCTKGSIHLDDLGSGYGVYVADQDQVLKKVDGLVPAKEGIDAVLAEFADAILHNRPALSAGEDNLNTLAAIAATSDSSRDDTEKYTSDYLSKEYQCSFS